MKKSDQLYELMLKKGISSRILKAYMFRDEHRFYSRKDDELYQHRTAQA